MKIENASATAHMLLEISNDISIVANKIEENNKGHWDLGKELNQFCVKVTEKINEEPDVYKLDQFEVTELVNLFSKYVEHHKKVATNYDLVLEGRPKLQRHLKLWQK
jgi:hypothetical protein